MQQAWHSRKDLNWNLLQMASSRAQNYDLYPTVINYVPLLR